MEEKFRLTSIMVRVHKRASKRQTTKQRAKVTRKINEHHRKVRREAKRNPQWKSRAKKDPGIPNTFPYKEELLNEIEQRRLEAEERKMMAKVDTGDDDDEEEEGGDDEDRMVEAEAEATLSTAAVSPPPLFASALDETLGDKRIVIVLTVDARDPSSFRVPWLESSAKRLVIALTKTDLVPKEMLTGWLYTLRESRPTFALALPPMGETAGVDVLAEHLGKSTALVVGLENVR